MNLSYRGYATFLKQDPDSQIWHGQVADIQDVVTFDGKTQRQAAAAFRQSVDVYLSFSSVNILEESASAAAESVG